MFDEILKEKNSYKEMDWKEICSQDTLKELNQTFVFLKWVNFNFIVFVESAIWKSKFLINTENKRNFYCLLSIKCNKPFQTSIRSNRSIPSRNLKLVL